MPVFLKKIHLFHKLSSNAKHFLYQYITKRTSLFTAHTQEEKLLSEVYKLWISYEKYCIGTYLLTSEDEKGIFSFWNVYSSLKLVCSASC